MLYFAILENLRIFQNCLYTGGVVEGNGSCRAAFCESAAGSRLALSVTAHAVPPLPKGEALAKPETLPLCQGLSLWESCHRR